MPFRAFSTSWTRRRLPPSSEWRLGSRLRWVRCAWRAGLMLRDRRVVRRLFLDALRRGPSLRLGGLGLPLERPRLALELWLGLGASSPLPVYLCGSRRGGLTLGERRWLPRLEGAGRYSSPRSDGGWV